MQYYWFTNILQYFGFQYVYCNTSFRIAIRIVFYPLFPLIWNLFEFNIFSLEIDCKFVIYENLFLQQLSFEIYFIESKHMTCMFELGSVNVSKHRVRHRSL